jgi:signal peptidase II
MSPKAKAFLGALGVALPLDQATKLWVSRSLDYSDRISVIDGFFYITHVRNPGAAFGMFVDAAPALRFPLFIGVALIAVGIIVNFYRKLAPGEKHAALTLGLILGGALGNLVDRIFRGEVVDFLHVRLWSGYSWPDFNLADSFIVVGVGLLLLELLAAEGESRAERRSPEPGT